MKLIAYLLGSNGVDGREPTYTERVFFDESQRDAALKEKPGYYSSQNQIVDVEEMQKAALAKLTPLEKAVLMIDTKNTKVALVNNFSSFPDVFKEIFGAKTNA